MKSQNQGWNSGTAYLVRRNGIYWKDQKDDMVRRIIPAPVYIGLGVTYTEYYLLPFPLPNCSLRHLESVVSLTRPLSRDDPVITDYKPPFQRLPQNLEVTNYDGLTCFHLAALHRFV